VGGFEAHPRLVDQVPRLLDGGRIIGQTARFPEADRFFVRSREKQRVEPGHPELPIPGT